MVDEPLPLTIGPYGFAWGPINVTRVMSIEGRVAVGITTDTGRTITVYVSPTGRSIRVFGDGGEWTADE